MNKTIIPQILKRKSGTNFNPDKKISPNKILILKEACRWAPSCYGEEPWRYVFCDKFISPLSHQHISECLVEQNAIWAKNAPLLIICAHKNIFSKTRKINRWAAYDTGAASILLCLQAVSLGLMTHQMGGFSAKKVKEKFFIPDNITIMSIMAVGYEANNPNEHRTRVRKQINNCFSDSKWSDLLE